MKDSFNAADGPFVVANAVGHINLNIMDPVIVQQLYTSKNNIFDKNEMTQVLMSDLFGDGILFSKGDELWKAKRKATAHAFYKDKVVHMLQILKIKITESFQNWMQAIDQSGDGSVTIDITQEFELIFARSIIHIAFGEDINDEEIEVYMRTDPDCQKPFKKQSVKLNTALKELFDQAIKAIRFKVFNPLFFPAFYLFGKTVPFT